MSPLLVKEIFTIVEELHKGGITILLVEQNAKMTLAVSDRAYEPETGTISMEGRAAGHNITRKLSDALSVPYYDRDLLRKASEVSGIHERLFGAADERIGLKEMLSAAEKVYTGEILPPDSNDYVSTRNLFS